MSDKNRVYIFDTTMRDGEQSPGASMSLEEKIQIARCFDELGIDVIEAGFPIASPGDFEAVTEISKVLKKVESIPYGKTSSYKSIAIKTGNANASRAVGNANANNPLPIIIPCHRVIANDGNIGGYGGGLKTKRFLLELEGAL